MDSTENLGEQQSHAPKERQFIDTAKKAHITGMIPEKWENYFGCVVCSWFISDLKQ